MQMELDLRSLALSSLTAIRHLTAGVVLITFLYGMYRAASDPLRNIPGPFLTRFTRLWYLKQVNEGGHSLGEVQLHRRYGPVVRLAPNQYSFSDISAVKTIYNHGAKFPKTDFYEPFGVPMVGQANIFQEQNIDFHAQKRRRIASLYSMSSILSYEPFVDNCIRTYFDRLDGFAKEDQAIDVAAWMQYYAFDVIGAISIGNPYGFLEHGNDFPGIIHEMRSTQAFATHLGIFAGSWFQSIAAIMSKVRSRPPFTAIQEYTQASLQRKYIDIENGKSLQGTTGKKDFAEKLLSLKAQGKVSQFEVEGSVRANIAAGSDTTGVSLSAIMYYLISNPKVLTKLREEVDVLKKKQVDITHYTTFIEAQEMLYLQACIKEALRLHSAVGMQLPRVVPEGGAHMCGRFFPAGTIVGVNPWVIHRQTDLFGEDAEQFRPERWLENEEKAKAMDRSILTFGAGSRTCIGKHISMLEIQKLVPELVHRYDFQLVDEKKGMQVFSRFFAHTNYECIVRRRAETQG